MTKQKGFSAVIVLLSILVVTAVGFTGYYVWNSQQDKKADQQPEATITQPKSTDSKQTSSETTNTTQNTQKYLVIKEWGVVLDGIESGVISYKMIGQNSVGFIVPSSKSVSEDCRDLGIGIVRASNKDSLPQINIEYTKFVNGYYYSIGGSPGACNNDPDSVDYKTNWDAVDYMRRLSTDSIKSIN